MSQQDNAVMLGNIEAESIREVVVPYLGTPHGDNVSVRAWTPPERVSADFSGLCYYHIHGRRRGRINMDGDTGSQSCTAHDRECTGLLPSRLVS